MVSYQQEEYINAAIASINEVRHHIEELKRYMSQKNAPINTDATDFLIRELFSVLLGKYRNAGVDYRARSYELENSID